MNTETKENGTPQPLLPAGPTKPTKRANVALTSRHPQTKGRAFRAEPVARPPAARWCHVGSA
jgi:hypothetical protein